MLNIKCGECGYSESMPCPKCGEVHAKGPAFTLSGKLTGERLYLGFLSERAIRFILVVVVVFGILNHLLRSC